MHLSLTESQITLIAGGIMFILSVLLMVFYHRSRRLLDEMWAVDMYTASELRKMCSDGFRATVEVQGNITCDTPVMAPASNLPCCWCRTRVDREDEYVVMTKYGPQTQRRWEAAYDHTLTTLFKVNDVSGWTFVEPTNADIDTEDPFETVVMAREPWFGVEVRQSDTGRYRIREEIFIPTGYVYVLGQATNCQEGPVSDVIIHDPGEGYTDPKHPFFIISRKSEKQLTEINEFSTGICFWVAIVGFLFAAYCVLHSFALIH